MEEKGISRAVIKRLPRYYRYLGELLEDGVERISSGELSERMKVTASQIRQDLNNFGGFGQQLDYDCVLINNIQGAFNATNYLIQCGHKNVGYFHSSLDISNFSERADGYYKALRANGISTSHPYVHPVSPTSDEGYRDMLRLLESKAPIADAYSDTVFGGH